VQPDPHSGTLAGSGIADPPAKAVAWVDRDKATQHPQRESTARQEFYERPVLPIKGFNLHP
jgi:hypothetical protein